MPDDILPPDSPIEADSAPHPTPPHIKAVRKFIFTMGVLFLFWLIFGHAVPWAIFPKKATDPVAAPAALPQESSPAEQARIVELETRVKALEEALAALPAEGNRGAQDAKIAELEAQLHALQQIPAQASAASAADSERVLRLESELKLQAKTLAEMKDQYRDAQQKQANALAALTLFMQMKEALQHGESIKTSLNQFRSLVQDRPKLFGMLAPLEAYGEKNPDTFSDIQHAFGKTLSAALASATDHHSLSANLHSLITIRKVGEEQQGSDDESVLARAEAAINKGEIERCLSEISHLSPLMAGAFVGWVQRAQEYVQLQALLASLQLALAANAPETPAAAP